MIILLQIATVFIVKIFIIELILIDNNTSLRVEFRIYIVDELSYRQTKKFIN